MELNQAVMKGDQELQIECDDAIKQKQLKEKRNRTIKTKISELDHST